MAFLETPSTTVDLIDCEARFGIRLVDGVKKNCS